MYVTKVSVKNVGGLGAGARPVDLDLTRPNRSPAGWTVVAGRNGSGKTTLLRSVALAIAGPGMARALMESFRGWIHDGEAMARASVRLTGSSEDALLASEPTHQSGSATLQWTRTNGPEPELNAVGRTKWLRQGPWAENPRGWMLAAYGPFRRLATTGGGAPQANTDGTRVAGIASLFRDDVVLAESVAWMRDIYLRRLEGSRQHSVLEHNVLHLLNDGLLPDGARVTRMTSEGLWVEQDGLELALTAVSDGYRAVAALVLDIVRRIAASFGRLSIEDAGEHPRVLESGVVLIDEVDAHIHVSWQQSIGFWLKSHFPHIQFVVSTHSSFVCQAADPGGLIRLPPPGSHIAAGPVREETFARVVNGTVDDAVLTDLFGLEQSYSHRSELLRDRVATLEVRVARGSAVDDDVYELERLRTELPQTLSSDVASALRRLAK